MSGPNLGLDDFGPTQGQLEFSNEVSLQTIDLTVIPDEIPEGNETFTLRLLNPRGEFQFAEVSIEWCDLLSSADSSFSIS